MQSIHRRFSILLLCVAIVSNRDSSGAEWNLDADGRWDIASNWLGTIPDGTSATAVFSNSITADHSVTIIDPTDNNVTLNQLIFDGHFGYTLLLPTGQTLSLAGVSAASIILPGNQGNAQQTLTTFSGGTGPTLASNLVLENDSAGLFTIGYSINGSNGTFTKQGYGDVALTYGNAATWNFDAGTIISIGLGSAETLNFNGGRWVGSSTASDVKRIVIGPAGGTIDTASLALTSANQLVGTGLLRKEGRGTFTLSASQPGFTGQLEVRSGFVNASDSSQPLVHATGFGIDGVNGVYAGQLKLGSSNFIGVPISVGPSGVLIGPSGVNAGFSTLTRGVNLTLAPGAVVAQTTNNGNASIQGLGPTQDLMFGLGVTQNILSLTIGVGTPWSGLSGIQTSDVTLNSTSSGTITANSDFTLQHYDHIFQINNTNFVSTGTKHVVTISAPISGALSIPTFDQVSPAGGGTEEVLISGNSSFAGVSKFIVSNGAVFKLQVAGVLGTGSQQAQEVDLQAGSRFIKTAVTNPAAPDGLGTGSSATAIVLQGTSRVSLDKPIDASVPIGGKLIIESTLPSTVALTNPGTTTNTSGLDSLTFSKDSASLVLSGSVDGPTTILSQSASLVSSGSSLRGGLIGSGTFIVAGGLSIDGALSSFGGPGSQIRIGTGPLVMTNAALDTGPDGPSISIGDGSVWGSVGIYSIPNDVDAGAKLTPDSAGVLAIGSDNSTITGVNGSSACIGANGTRTLSSTSLAPGSGGVYRFGGGLNTPVLNINGANVLTGPNDLQVGIPISSRGTTIGAASTIVLQNSNSYTGKTVISPQNTLVIQAANGIGNATASGPIVIDGTLRIESVGSIGATGPITINYNGTLAIDDISVPIADRIPDSTPIQLKGGLLSYATGNQTSSPIHETIGNVSIIEGAVRINGGSTFKIGNLDRQLGTTLGESGAFFSIGNGSSLVANGIIPWIGGVTFPPSFTTSISNRLTPYSGPQPPQIEGATSTDNVVTGSTVDPLTTDRTINSLNLRANNASINTNGHVLNIGTAPVNGIASGAVGLRSGNVIGTGPSPGYLTAGQSTFASNSAAPGELIIYAFDNPSTIAASIIDNAGPDGMFGNSDDLPVTLTKAGIGTLILSGSANTYSGGTYLNAGTLSSSSPIPGNITLHTASLNLSSSTPNSYLIGGDLLVSTGYQTTGQLHGQLQVSYTGPATNDLRPALQIHGLTVVPGSSFTLSGELGIAGTADVRGAHINSIPAGLNPRMTFEFRGSYIDDAQTVFAHPALNNVGYNNSYRFVSGNISDVHATFTVDPTIAVDNHTSVNFYGNFNAGIDSPSPFSLSVTSNSKILFMPGSTINAARGWDGLSYKCRTLDIHGDSSGTIEFVHGFKLMPTAGTNHLADIGANQIAIDDPITLITNDSDNLPNFPLSAISAMPPNVYFGHVTVQADGSRWIVQSNPQSFNQKLEITADTRIVTNTPLTLTPESALAMGVEENVLLANSGGALEKLGDSDLTILGRLYVADYTKMIVGQGRLVLSNRTYEGYGQMDVEVRSGGTLAGGSVDGAAGLIPGTLTVKAGGIVDPGNNSYGILSIIGDHPDIKFLAQSVFRPNIGGVVPGQTYDQIKLLGSLRLGDNSGLPVLDPQLTYTPDIGDLIYLLQDDSTAQIAGLFATQQGTALEQDDLFSLVSQVDGRSYEFQISYHGDVGTNQFDVSSGNDIVLRVVAVPEPSGFALAWLAVMTILCWLTIVTELKPA